MPSPTACKPSASMIIFIPIWLAVIHLFIQHSFRPSNIHPAKTTIKRASLSQLNKYTKLPYTGGLTVIRCKIYYPNIKYTFLQTSIQSALWRVTLFARTMYGGSTSPPCSVCTGWYLVCIFNVS